MKLEGKALEIYKELIRPQRVLLVDEGKNDFTARTVSICDADGNRRLHEIFEENVTRARVSGLEVRYCDPPKPTWPEPDWIELGRGCVVDARPIFHGGCSGFVIGFNVPKKSWVYAVLVALLKMVAEREGNLTAGEK